QLALTGYLVRDVPARAWPRELIRRALPPQPEGSPQDVMASLYAYTQALDAGDVETARAFLPRFLVGYGRPYVNSPTLALEAAYFIARYWPDPVMARAWLARGDGAPHQSFMHPRAKAAILLAEGRIAEAGASAAVGLEALRRVREHRETVSS